MTDERPAEAEFTVPTCSLCQRARTLGEGEHPMDAYDYSPLQVMTGQPMGWYSGDDGEVCPEDMERTVRGQLGAARGETRQEPEPDYFWDDKGKQHQSRG